MAQIQLIDAKLALDSATSITVCMKTYGPSGKDEWRERRPSQCAEAYNEELGDSELLADSTVKRGDPRFEARMADLASMMRRKATEEITAHLVAGNKLRIWPYMVTVANDYEFGENRERAKCTKPILDMDQELEFCAYMDQGASLDEAAELFGLSRYKAAKAWKQIREGAEL